MPRDRSSWPRFLQLWERLCQETENPGTVIVVEGDRDRAILRSLGIRGRILLLHNGQRLGTLAQQLGDSGARVVVLTDWDRAGGHLAHRLADLLPPAAIDLDFRRRLARALQGEVAHVEGLAAWARRMAERAGAPLEHWLTSPFR